MAGFDAKGGVLVEKQICPRCGEPNEGDKRFCIHCGAALARPAEEERGTATLSHTGEAGETAASLGVPAEEEGQKVLPAPEKGENAADLAKAPEALPVAPIVQNPTAAPPALAEEPEEGPEEAPGRKSRYAPISTGGFLGIFLLLLIPGVNVVLLILWATGHCRKQMKQNFARALLIFLLAAALVILFFSTPLGQALWKDWLLSLGRALPWVKQLPGWGRLLG